MASVSNGQVFTKWRVTGFKRVVFEHKHLTARLEPIEAIFQRALALGRLDVVEHARREHQVEVRLWLDVVGNIQTTFHAALAGN